MSRYESEWGDIYFSKTGYPTFVRAFRTNYNKYIDEVFAIAQAAYEHLSNIKGAGNTKKRHAAWAAIVDENRINLHVPGCYARHGFSIEENDIETLQEELFRGGVSKGGDFGNGTLTKPRKSSFPRLTNKQLAFTVDCSSEAYLSFNKLNDGRGCINWRVEENNHSIDKARGSRCYGIFKATLSAYTWRRNEGGVWYYESEYTRDGAKESGGGDSTSESEYFGPAGKESEEQKYAQLGFGKKRRRQK
jgi:hypothetical protein